MKDTLKQYLWIFSITAGLLTVAILLFPEKKNRLEYIEERLDNIERQKSVLTEKEKELERLATEKEWEEIDKETNK